MVFFYNAVHFDTIKVPFKFSCGVVEKFKCHTIKVK